MSDGWIDTNMERQMDVHSGVAQSEVVMSVTGVTRRRVNSCSGPTGNVSIDCLPDDFPIVVPFQFFF